jgi:hypothetical protein
MLHIRHGLNLIICGPRLPGRKKFFAGLWNTPFIGRIWVQRAKTSPAGRDLKTEE